MSPEETDRLGQVDSRCFKESIFSGISEPGVSLFDRRGSSNARGRTMQGEMKVKHPCFGMLCHN